MPIKNNSIKTSTLALSLALGLMSPWALANTLPAGGQSFAVKEDDFLTFIAARLQALKASGQLAADQKKAVISAQHTMVHPNALPIGTCPKAQVIFNDPTIRLNQSLVDPSGKVLVPAGTLVNPFKTVTFSKKLVFF